MARTGSATPGVYASDKSYWGVHGLLGTTLSFPGGRRAPRKFGKAVAGAHRRQLDAQAAGEGAFVRAQAVQALHRIEEDTFDGGVGVARRAEKTKRLLAQEHHGHARVELRQRR